MTANTRHHTRSDLNERGARTSASLVFALVLALAIVSSDPAIAQPSDAPSSAPASTSGNLEARHYFLADFAVLQGKLEALAAVIPEDKYAWRPSEGARSFSEVYHHVMADHFGGVMTFFGVHRDTVAATLREARAMAPSAGKSEIAGALQRAGAGVRLAISAVDTAALLVPLPSPGRPRNLVRASVHMTGELHEHLGQLIAYARSVGIAPPWSTY